MVSEGDRLLFGRTREESLALARIEAGRREMREAAREGRCFVVHAPEIWGGYCETHRRPVDRGNRCDRSPR